ncbi:MAG: hypothetical protein V1848_00305 [Candidatus Magasanikbacteria bacterium]
MSDNMLTERQKQLLGLVMDQYIHTAEPVGSVMLVEKSNLGISGATVRNELRVLEELAYLTHPHTSAGRIPTEKGYILYREEFIQDEPVEKQVVEELEILAHAEVDEKQKKKLFAKFLAEATHLAVIMVQEKNSLYYTGITNLLAQPEFKEYQNTLSVSALFDGCEDCLEEMYELAEEKSILIGSENPLSSICTTLVCPIANDGILMLIGPMRMNYNKNKAILEAVKKYLE